MTEIDIAQSPAGAPLEYDVKIVDGNFMAHASASQASGAVSEDVTFKLSGASIKAAVVAEINAKTGALAPIFLGLANALFSAIGVA